MTSAVSYRVLHGVSLAILGLWLLCSAVKADPCKCQPLTTPDKPFDPCSTAGIFKSNSTLHPQSATIKTPVLPYDYYQCITAGATFIRYNRRCSSAYTFYTTAAAATPETYYNAFDEKTTTCTAPMPTDAVVSTCTLPEMCTP